MSQRKVFQAFIGIATMFLLALPAAIFLLAFPDSAQAYDYSYARIVRLSLVQGEVQITRPNQTEWEKAVANMPMQQGFTIATNDGRAEIEFESGATARIAENTVLQFTELALSNGGRITKLTVTQGTANFYANLKSDDSFSVATPQLQVTIPARAEFRLDVFKDGTSVSVFKGDASVVTPAGTKEVNKGQTLAFSASAPDQVRIEANPPEDDWDRWVDNRENSITTATSQTLRYTSAPFDYGMADLSSYGGWNYYPGYGYGWRPWGIASGWAPFWNGYWSFFPGLGWTWVSYEPWGWVPYHFGSWAFSPLYGWLWLPGYYNYWCPAPVQWVVVGNQIGWTPVRPTPVLVGPGGRAPTLAPPIVVSRGRFGPRGPLQVLPNQELNGKVEILPAPPLANGKMPRGATVGAGSTVVVPTAPGLARLGSGVVFDPVTRRFVANGSGPAVLPAAPVVGNAGAHVRRVPPMPPTLVTIPPVRNPIMPPTMAPPPHHVVPPWPPANHQPPPPPPTHAEPSHPTPHAMSFESHAFSPPPPPAAHASGGRPH